MTQGALSISISRESSDVSLRSKSISAGVSSPLGKASDCLEKKYSTRRDVVLIPFYPNKEPRHQKRESKYNDSETGSLSLAMSLEQVLRLKMLCPPVDYVEILLETMTTLRAHCTSCTLAWHWGCCWTAGPEWN